MNKRNKLKKQWKKICATALAVCMIGSILLSNGVGGAFAEEDTVQQEEQTEEASTQEENKTEEAITAEEKTTEASTEKKEEVTTEEKKAEESKATTENKKRSVAKAQQADWKYTDDNITVSGNGTNPQNISKTSGSNESQYAGSKVVVFDYNISSTTELDGEATITISDCGIMSDDTSLEIWHIKDSKATQIANGDMTRSEGKVSFTTTELGEYIAVSNVTTVDLSKTSVTVFANRISGKRQDGKTISQEFSTGSDKKYRISQTDKDSRVENSIYFSQGDTFQKNRTIIIDNINTSQMISIPAKDATKLVTLQLRGTNQVKQIYYGTGNHDQKIEEVVNNDDSRLKIENYGESDGTSGKLYIPYKMNSRADEINYILTKSDKIGDNWAAAGIGGSGGLNNSTGLTIAGGTIKVLGKNANGATAIGGGGNGDGQVTITGGDITAICSSTGAAIGGGIGWVFRGGNADVSITGGTVHAENINYYSRGSINFGGVAIGSGSSTDMYGSKAKINISGNSNVKAYAHYGNAIGSGNSYKSSAANADITIGGNSIVKTNALGGGTSKANQGGSADIVVKDSATVTCEKYSEITDKWDEDNENMLNAYGIGGGNSTDTSDGGSANVTVTGGTLNCNGGNIGGGDSTGSGNGGNASIYVTGGRLNCASIGGGNSVSGKPGSVSTSDGKAGVIVTGDDSNVKAGTIGGGTNSNGDIGFATVDISGGKIQGQFILSNTDSDKQCTFKMTGGVIDNTGLGTGNYKKAQENGGAVYLSDPNGKVSISGGTIQNCKAELGGAVYMTAGEISLSGTGKIQDCTATQNGGAIYLGKGKVSISGGSIGDKDHGNHATKGAGIYQANGEMLIEGGTILANHATEDGGGSYLTGGELKITGGAFTLNDAKNGGAVYVSDSKIRMFGGSFTTNTAKNNGGAMYISSDNSPADVIIRSGTINKNTAGDKDVQGNGGGIAVVSSTGNSEDQVIIGLCETHKNLDINNHTFDPFPYTDTADNETHTHESCPVLKENESYGNGGGIYMSSSNAELNMYCLEESGNISRQDSAGNGVMSTGGTVNIGDQEHCDKDARGNIVINSSMLVSGGTVSVFGNMNNPLFKSNILVNIKNNAGKFQDHRKSVQADDQRYKVHYFENFEGSGSYSALQYDNQATIQAEGALYNHEGWRIVGWQDKKTSKIYYIGDIIGSATDHTAWGTDADSALELNALWERTKYTIKFDPNAEDYSGTAMDPQTFTYNVSAKLSQNQYKVKGKRFTGWNTQPDGKGQSYDENYSDSKISSKENDTVTLYAQWVDCTHNKGNHPGTITYQKNDKGDMITEICDCGGHTVSVTLSGITAYHDGNSHPVTLTYTGGTLFGGTPTITYQYRKASDDTYGNLINGEITPQSIGYYKASITVGNQTATVEYEIKSPSAGITQEAKVIKGQYFKAFNGQSGVKIAQDDAFTVHYTIKNLKTDLYTEVPTLKFNQKLPQNTKVIMLRENKYWYDTVEQATDSIKLTDFIKMGATKKYEYTADQKTSDQEYSFIVDFSKTTAQIAGELTTTLNYSYTGNEDNVAPSAKVTLENKETFAIQQEGTQMTVKAPTGGTDTRWENKKLFLRLTKSSTSGEELPSDAKLTVVKGEQTKSYTMNQRGEFLISLNWEESQSIQLSIHSDAAQAKGKTYDFTAKLETASNDPDEADTTIQASESGTKATQNDIRLSVPTQKKPSLKLEASGTEKRIFTTSEKLNLNVTEQNIDQATMKAKIQKKTGTDYSGVYLDTNVSKGENNFTLGGIKESGSYRLIVTVTENDQTILTIPYYFVIEE